MDPRVQPVFTQDATTQSGSSLAESQHRVLRNTYWLLALSMLPTIGGRMGRHAVQLRQAVHRLADR